MSVDITVLGCRALITWDEIVPMGYMDTDMWWCFGMQCVMSCFPSFKTRLHRERDIQSAFSGMDSGDEVC